MKIDEVINYVNKSLKKFKEYDSFKSLVIYDYKSFISYIDKELND